MSKSVMTHTFQNTPSANIPRSSFDLSHGYKTTFDAGFLIPFIMMEALPGDTYNLKVTAFARLATPIKPIMDNMFMETFFFSVPVRQVWDNWEKFNGEQVSPSDSTDFVVPEIDLLKADTISQSIWDYFGIPTDIDMSVNALHPRAYSHIYNQWFRDQNLETTLPILRGDGPDPASSYAIVRRRKRPDYFTSCLPFPQKGDPVTIPITGEAPVIGLGLTGTGVFSETSTAVRESDLSTPTYAISRDLTGTGTWHIEGTAATAGFPKVFADLAQVTGVTVNELRESFQVQRLLERDARSGTRYPEILRAHFGVTDPQMLVLQRPEFLGGGSSRINIQAVEQTAYSGTDIEVADTPQGNLAGFGTVTLNNHGFTKSFTEHCLIIGIVNVRADITYQQGLNRMWSRRTRFDYYWPVLNALGEQSVLNQEIFTLGDGPVTDELVFGYQERYAEYRYQPSLITGKFRSNDPASLDVWHLSQEFVSVPTLNAAFIRDDPPIDRVIAVQTEPHFLFDAYIKCRVARPMPLYGVPGMIDHF